jgi:hypothetical protein
MSRLREYLVDRKTTDLGKLLLDEEISKSQVSLIKTIVEKVNSITKLLPHVIDMVETPQWREYIENFYRQCGIISNVLSKVK